MAAGKIEPVICDTPFELWPNLQFVMGHGMNELYEINMPNLSYLGIDSAGISRLPYSSLKKLDSITMYGANLGALELCKMPNIRVVNLTADGITSLDANGCSNMERLNISSNTNLTGINIENCSSLDYLNADYCSLSLNDVNHITYFLVQYGVTNGDLYLRYGNNSPPSQIADTNISCLIGRGWKVYTN